MRIEVLADLKTALGEGPLWDVREQRLYWLDAVAGRIHRCTAQGAELRSWQLPGRIGAMALREQGGAVVALDSGLHFLDLDTGELEFVVHPEQARPGNCLNDGKVDRQGRFVFASMDRGEQQPSGRLFRLDAALRLHCFDEFAVVVGNGPCWSPDGTTFYFQDSAGDQIWAQDYGADPLGPRRVFARIDKASGACPDGSTVDAEGCLWNAEVFAGRLRRYTPDGRVDRVIELPVRSPTSVMFGGPDLDTLFVTSMASFPPHWPHPDGPARGAVLALHGLGVRGLPERRFAG